MTPTPPAGAEPSPEARKLYLVHPDHGMMEDVADIIGRNGWDGLAATVRAADEALQSLRSDLTAARARIGELEKEAEQDRSFREWCYVTVGTDNLECLKTLLENGMKDRAALALAKATAEEARRAGVKCFDESHPDDLGQRIHAIMEAHEKEHRHHIYRRSLLEKALFEMLNQPLK